MKRAEILLNLVIGICGSLIAALIYSRLQKIHWRRIRRQVLNKTKQAVNDALVMGVIASYSFKRRGYILRPTLAFLTTAVFLAVIWFATSDFTKKNEPVATMDYGVRIGSTSIVNGNSFSEQQIPTKHSTTQKRKIKLLLLRPQSDR